MTDIFYWTGLVAIFAVAFIAGQMVTPEKTLKPVPIKAQGSEQLQTHRVIHGDGLRY